MRTASPDLDRLLRQCIHCGLCLNHCPTYRLSGDEADSPRGRLLLLSDLLGGEEPGAVEPVDRRPLDRCLGCLACEHVCPSGVEYGALLARGRARLGPRPSAGDRLLTWMVDAVLSRPAWLAVGSVLGQGMRAAGLHALLPPSLASLVERLPRRRARWPRRPSFAGPRGPVALLAGCAQRVYTPEVLQACSKLVRAVGEVPAVPAGQGCCGALSHHEGSTDRARDLARRTIDAFASAEVVVVPSAGCSAHMRAYGELLADDPVYAEAARSLAAKTVDFVVWLAERADSLALRPDPRRVVYHPPCHHLHAQRIDGPAQKLLDRVPELEHTEPPRRHLCCGSAGSFSLHEPAIAEARRREKVQDLLACHPDLVLTSNPGCELYLDAAPELGGTGVEVQHLAVYLAERLFRAPAHPQPFRG